MTNRKARHRLFTLLAIRLRIASKKIAMQNHGNAQQQRRIDITALQQFRNVGRIHKQFPCQPRSAAFLRFQFFFDQIANVNVVGHFSFHICSASTSQAASIHKKGVEIALCLILLQALACLATDKNNSPTPILPYRLPRRRKTSDADAIVNYLRRIKNRQVRNRR